MRTPTIPLTLLAVVLIGCADEPPTALSAGRHGAAAGVAANRAALPFRGTVEASETHEHQPDMTTVLIHVVGTGTATHLGRYTLVADVVGDLSTLKASERITLTAANGDILTATADEQATPTADFSALTTVEIATITGGTGRFAGATGSFLLERVLSLASGASTGLYTSTGSFTGSIRLAH